MPLRIHQKIVTLLQLQRPFYVSVRHPKH